MAESGATLLEFATPDETVAAVRNGEADAVFADKDYLVPIQKESAGAFVFAGEDVQLGGGVGLGLSVSYGLVRACGGDIRVASRTGEGATFEIRLPREDRLAARDVPDVHNA